MWVINGTPFNQSTLQSSSLYRLNYPTTAMINSLTIFAINDSTTIQCIVQSNPVTYSRRGTITVTGMCVCMYMYIHTLLCTYTCVYVYKLLYHELR